MEVKKKKIVVYSCALPLERSEKDKTTVFLLPESAGSAGPHLGQLGHLTYHSDFKVAHVSLVDLVNW